jgi:hypothetical protein
LDWLDFREVEGVYRLAADCTYTAIAAGASNPWQWTVNKDTAFAILKPVEAKQEGER